MFDFIFKDLQLMFPFLTEEVANTITKFNNVLEFILLIALIVAEWQIFKKFGEKPWKSLIPYYSIYIKYKNTWSKKAFWVFFSTSVGFELLSLSSMLVMELTDNPDLASILILIAVPLGIIAAINTILAAFRMAEAFGKGVGFGFGLIFFESIFSLILGFGKAKFVGIAGQPVNPKNISLSKEGA